MTRRRRPAAALVVCLGLLSGCGAEDELPRSGSPIEAWQSGPCADFRFPQQDWTSQANDRVQPGQLTPRQRIADRVVECDVLAGRSIRAVVALLGRPDERGGSPLMASYWLGDERGPVQIDSEYLNVTFGSGGRVRDVAIADG